MIDVPQPITDAIAQKFKDSYPEYHNSPKNAQLLGQAFNTLVDAGHPYSSDSLAAAYHALNAGGQLEQPEVEEVIEIPKEEARQRWQIDKLATTAETLSDDQLDKALLSLGVYVPKRNGSMWRD